MADPNLDESFGIKSDQPKPATPEKVSPVNPAALGSKVLQSATFGFGADAAGAIFGKQAEQTIRGLEQRYDKDNPFWSFGIDLAVGAAEGMALGGASAPASAARMIG